MILILSIVPYLVYAQNPGPGSPAPNIILPIYGGGTFDLSSFQGQNAVLITNHIIDDGPVSWAPLPFKQLQYFQQRYPNLKIFIVPELAHNYPGSSYCPASSANIQTFGQIVNDFLNPGSFPLLLTNFACPTGYGLGQTQIYQTLNPQGLTGWWPMLLVDQNGIIRYSSYNPKNNFAEHMMYQTFIREALMQIYEPSNLSNLISQLPQDFVSQNSPWGNLLVEDFERYNDLFEYFISTAWLSNPPFMRWKGAITKHPLKKTGYHALTMNWMRHGNIFGFPYYYGYQDPFEGSIFAKHDFPGPPNGLTGTFAFYLTGERELQEYDYGKGSGVTFNLGGPGGQDLGFWLGDDGTCSACPIGYFATTTGTTWNPERWQRLSFHITSTGTTFYVDNNIVGAYPLTGLKSIKFIAGMLTTIDDMIFVPQQLTPQQLDAVYNWVDEHAIDRPHVTPLEIEQQIAQLNATTPPSSLPTVLRVDWGSNSNYIDSQGNKWLAEQPYIRGTFGYVDGDTYNYPPTFNVPGTNEDGLYRTLRYSMTMLRFNAPEGIYRLIIHTNRFHDGPSYSVYNCQCSNSLMSVDPEPAEWTGPHSVGPNQPGTYSFNVPYQSASSFTIDNIAVNDGVLDVRFYLMNPASIAATELIKLSGPTSAGIPNFTITQGPVTCNNNNICESSSGENPTNCPQDCAPPVLNNLNPSAFINNIGNTVQLTGNNFVPNAVVLINGGLWPGFWTSYGNWPAIDIFVPAGSPAGVHQVKVRNPSGLESNVLPLTVIQGGSINMPNNMNVGQTIPIQLSAPAHPGKTYILLASFGNNPQITIYPGFTIPLLLDTLLIGTLENPSIFGFTNSIGTLSGAGSASAQLTIYPSWSFLSNSNLYLAFVVIDLLNPINLISTISQSYQLHIN